MKVNLKIDKVGEKLDIGDVLVFSRGETEDYYMVVRDSSFGCENSYRLLELRDGFLHDKYTTLEEILPHLNSKVQNNFVFDRIIKSNQLELRQIPKEE